MQLLEYKESLNQETAPPDLSPALESLWYDAKGNWNKAHKIAQDINDQTGSWVHAYLHRKEGDLSNASYWYSRAGRSMPDVSLDQEWDEIVAALL